MKVIGYCAYSGQEPVYFDGEECLLISGSSEAMECYLAEFGSKWHDIKEARISRIMKEIGLGGGTLVKQPYTIKKIRFWMVVKGIGLGGACAFDEESYGRFYPLAVAEGLAVSEPSAFQTMSPGFKFLTVKIDK